MLEGLFPTLPAHREAEAANIYQSIFGDLALSAWRRQGTLITRFVNGRKLNFAARAQHCTVGFQGRDAVEFSLLIGGDCPAGEVTIKPYYGRLFCAKRIRDTIEWYLNN